MKNKKDIILWSIWIALIYILLVLVNICVGIAL